jgi:hypothetical protein
VKAPPPSMLLKRVVLYTLVSGGVFEAHLPPVSTWPSSLPDKSLWQSDRSSFDHNSESFQLVDLYVMSPLMLAWTSLQRTTECSHSPLRDQLSKTVLCTQNLGLSSVCH